MLQDILRNDVRICGLRDLQRAFLQAVVLTHEAGTPSKRPQVQYDARNRCASRPGQSETTVVYFH